MNSMSSNSKAGNYRTMRTLLTNLDNHDWKLNGLPTFCKRSYEVHYPSLTQVPPIKKTAALTLDNSILIPSDAFSLSEFPSEAREGNDLFDDMESEWNDIIIEPTPFREGTILEASPCDPGLLSSVQVRDGVFNPKTVGSTLHELLSEACDELSLILQSGGNNRKRGLDQSSTSASKRARSIPSNEDQGDGTSPQFRVYQDAQWQEQFESLLVFKQEFGHCNVPHTYEQDVALSRWVKRQRCQYKLKLDGKRTSMSLERQQNLDDVGFVWDPHTALWETRRHELEEYKQRHWHCNVPCRYADNPQLGMWVRSQRREYKLLRDGQLSRLTPERYRLLEEMGFSWEPRVIGRTNKATEDPIGSSHRI